MCELRNISSASPINAATEDDHYGKYYEQVSLGTRLLCKSLISIRYIIMHSNFRRMRYMQVTVRR